MINYNSDRGNLVCSTQGHQNTLNPVQSAIRPQYISAHNAHTLVANLTLSRQSLGMSAWFQTMVISIDGVPQGNPLCPVL